MDPRRWFRAATLLGVLAACGRGGDGGDGGDPCAVVPPPCPELWTCHGVAGESATCALEPEPEADSRATFDALTAGVSLPLHLPDRAEDTVGTLALGLHPRLVPIVTHPRGVLVAASTLGAGRVVAFSGQDFLSSGTRSTLLSEPAIARLVANAATWVQRGAAAPILVDNAALRDALRDQGVDAVEVVATEGDVRDWSVDLSRYAAVAIQVNEWGTARLDPGQLASLRAFVRGGGGLLVAGSAMHWAWWLTPVAPAFPGDPLLDGAGIAWSLDTLRDTSLASSSFDPHSSPLALWQAYVRGDAIGAADHARLADLFASALAQSVDIDPALERLVRETPALPVARTLPTAVLAAGVIRSLPPHRWPTPHPWAGVFPGVVAADVERVVGQVTAVERRWVGPMPLGLYAPPGEVVTIRVAAGHEQLGLTIRIGELHDDLSQLDDVATWRRAPLTFRTFALDATEITVGAPLGGSIYAVLPDGPAAAGTIELTVSGAVRQPLYVAGQTTDWVVARTYRAPQAILELPGKVRLSVATDALRPTDDPAAILAYWGGFYDSHFALAQEPVPRRRASHMIFDPQVGWGYANATMERIDHPKLAEVWALRRELATEDIWLFGHEMGHQFQTDNWTGGDITEVCVNLFTMYTLNGYRNGGGDRETRGHRGNAIDHAALKALRWPTADLFQKLEMYRQLVFEFGWDDYQRVFASYYDPGFSDAVDGTYLDGFAIRFSRIVGRDLTAFFDNWQYPLSAAARARIASLGLPTWLPPGW